MDLQQGIGIGIGIGIRVSVEHYDSALLLFLDPDRILQEKYVPSNEDVSSLIFIASLAEYHQTLVEDPTANRLQESVALFKTIFNIPWIKQTSIILFFNKKDIFKEKIKYFKLKNTFQDFGGDNTDLFETIKFIIQLFTDNPQTHRYVQCPKYNKSLSPLLLGWKCLPT